MDNIVTLEIEYNETVTLEKNTTSTWMNLGNLMLREISQIQKDKYYTIPLGWGTSSRPVPKDRKLNRGFQKLKGRRTEELLFNEYRVSVWDDEKVLEMDSSEGCTTLWMYLMPLNHMIRNEKTAVMNILPQFKQREGKCALPCLRCLQGQSTSTI